MNVYCKSQTKKNSHSESILLDQAMLRNIKNALLNIVSWSPSKLLNINSGYWISRLKISSSILFLITLYMFRRFSAYAGQFMKRCLWVFIYHSHDICGRCYVICKYMYMLVFDVICWMYTVKVKQKKTVTQNPSSWTRRC